MLAFRKMQTSDFASSLSETSLNTPSVDLHAWSSWPNWFVSFTPTCASTQDAHRQNDKVPPKDNR
jgi:hypothetical protein